LESICPQEFRMLCMLIEVEGAGIRIIPRRRGGSKGREEKEPKWLGRGEKKEG